MRAICCLVVDASGSLLGLATGFPGTMCFLDLETNT